MVAQTADFKKAIEDSRKLKAKPSDDELLQVRENTKHEGGSHMD
jgi:acyl-CoA-binding protein